MKTIIKTIILLFLITTNAQVEPLLDHDWRLEKVVTSDSTLVVPDEINMFAWFQGENENTYLGDCQNFTASAIYNNLDQSFTLTQPIIPLGNCGNTEWLSYEFFLYEEFYFENINNGTLHNPFTYFFTENSNKIYLDITNTNGDVATFWANTLSNDDFEENEFSIYPNPVSDQLHIEGERNQIQQIEIFNLNGKRVLNVGYQENQPIDVSSLAKGMYLVKVQTENGSLTKKLFKE